MKYYRNIFEKMESIKENSDIEAEIRSVSLQGFSLVRDLLEFSIGEQNGVWFNWALRIGYYCEPFQNLPFQGSKETRLWLSKLLGSVFEETWHTEHEDLVLILQDLYNIELVKPLHKAVFTKPPYLYEVDDADALSRKAIWALGKLVLPVIDIPVDEEASRAAIEVLKELSESDDPVVAERAKRQFDRFAENGIILE